MITAAGLILGSLVTLVCTSPLVHNLVVHEHIDNVPEGFINHGPASETMNLNLRIALVSNDMAGLVKALYDVSTPSSELYGQHLSKEKVETFVAPKPESVSAVNGWLTSNGLKSTILSPTGNWITVKMPVSKASELLGANFYAFTDSQTGKPMIRTLSYSIPSDLVGHIELIHPTITFERSVGLPIITSPIKQRSNVPEEVDPSLCFNGITPMCLQSLYGIPTTLATQSSNQLAVSGFIDQYAQQSDLETFLQSYRPDLSPTTSFNLQTLDGGSNPQGSGQAGIEANLDIQYTVGLDSGVPVTFISVGNNFQDGDLEGFLDIVNFLLNQENPPHVLTTSYGSSGQNENTMSQQLAINLCNAYAQLGARGTSILFASGDGGVAGSQPSGCSTFVPTFPSGCPYLTSVGATTGFDPETAAGLSAGGFSNYFNIPPYQSSVMASYISSLGDINSGLFNTAGCGYPDVGAQGENVQIVSAGFSQAVAGTSCASPIFASVISLLDNELITAGKSPLGFLNPFLYAHPSALNDITSGNNPGCNTDGFPAMSGWDPITGLGSPNYVALRAAVGL